MARPGLDKHPKFRRLTQILGECRSHVRGYLGCLWETGYEFGDPRLGDAMDVELAADWHGEPGKLCRALLDCGGEGRAGFIEPIPGEPGRYQIHDLLDHAPDYVQDRARREAERKKVKQCEHCGAEYHSSERHARFCSHGCRQLSYRKRRQELTQVDGGVREMLTKVDARLTQVDASPQPNPTQPNPKDPSLSPKLRFADEDLLTAGWILERIRVIEPAFRQPSLERWANDIRLMREQDRRSDDEIRELFAWANQDTFWRSNILSPAKLRKQWDQLSIKSRSKSDGRAQQGGGAGRWQRYQE